MNFSRAGVQLGSAVAPHGKERGDKGTWRVTCMDSAENAT